MKSKHIINCLILLSLVIFSLFISGCSHKDKEIVVTKSVKAEAKKEKNQVKKYIELGNKLFEKNKYNDAKSAYEKAIKLDKMNKQTYLTIEDKYLEKNKIEDAANIIQEAINNNVDTENMKKLLSQINAKLEAIKAMDEFNENKRKKEQNIKENQNTNNTSSQPKVVQNKRIIGYVQNIYEKGGKRYLTIDEIEFFMGDKAYKEAEKDGYGKDSEITSDNYYIRNKDKSVTEYEISNSCGFAVGSRQLDPLGCKNAAENQTVSYDKIKSLVNTNTNTSIGRGENVDNPENLYWLTITNNAIVQMDCQYVP